MMMMAIELVVMVMMMIDEGDDDDDNVDDGTLMICTVVKQYIKFFTILSFAIISVPPTACHSDEIGCTEDGWYPPKAM